MYNLEMRGLKAMVTSTLISGKGKLKVDPQLHTILALCMAGAESQNVGILRETLFRTGFLDGNNVETIVPHLLLEVVQLSSIARGSSIKSFYISRGKAESVYELSLFPLRQSQSCCGSIPCR
jgi:hypothetical protein